MKQPHTQGSEILQLNANLDSDLESIATHELSGPIADFAASVIDAGLSFEGRGYPVSIRPYVLSAAASRNLTSAAEVVVRVANRIPRAVRRSAALRELYPAYRSFLPLLVPGEECFLCRVDGILDTTGRFSILELNTACPGGVIQAGMAFRIWGHHADKLPLDYGGNRERSASSMTEDPLTADPHAFVRFLAAAYRNRHGDEPRCARVVNYQGIYTNEVDRIVSGLSDIGIDVRRADATEIVARGGQAYDINSAEPVDLVYNKLDPLALMTPELADYLAAWSLPSSVFINPLSAQWLLEDKATIAVLSDPAFRGELSVTDAENQVIDAVIPWTRFVRNGHTTGPDGVQINLLDFASAEQSRLVLKPGNASRGDGVIFGYRASPQEWKRELTHALASPHVLQERCVPMRLKVLPPGSRDVVEMNAGIDCFLIFGKFAGFHSRASTLDVMNIGKSGMLLPVHVVSGSGQ